MREPFTPVPGCIYLNNGAGSFFKCLGIATECTATLINVKSGWMLLAHGIGIYEDGSIDWDYSTGGTFVKGDF